MLRHTTGIWSTLTIGASSVVLYAQAANSAPLEAIGSFLGFSALFAWYVKHTTGKTLPDRDKAHAADKAAMLAAFEREGDKWREVLEGQLNLQREHDAKRTEAIAEAFRDIADKTAAESAQLRDLLHQTLIKRQD